MRRTQVIETGDFRILSHYGKELFKMHDQEGKVSVVTGAAQESAKPSLNDLQKKVQKF